MAKGRKNDAGKNMSELFDPVMRLELQELMPLYQKKPEDIIKTLLMLISCRMYMAACVLVIKHKKITIDQIEKVFTGGAKKYAPNNWVYVEADRYLGAALRHMKDGINKEDFGMPHWTHFCWNMIILRQKEKMGEIIYQTIKGEENGKKKEG